MADIYVTGTLSPDATGTYTEAGTYNSQPYWTLGGFHHVWYDGYNWRLTYNGGAGSSYEYGWTGPAAGVAGSYAPDSSGALGTPTGTAGVSTSPPQEVVGMLDGRKALLRSIFFNTPIVPPRIRLFINDFTPTPDSRLGNFVEPVGVISYPVSNTTFANWSFSRPGDYCLAQCVEKTISVRHRENNQYVACTVYGWFTSSELTIKAKGDNAMFARRFETPIEIPASGGTVAVSPYFQIASNNLFTEFGEEYVAKKLCGQGFSALYLYGYTNDYTPTKSSVKADFTLTAGAGFPAVGIAVEEILGTRRVRGVVPPNAGLTLPTAGTTVYGLVVLDNSLTNVVFAQRLATPITVQGLGAYTLNTGAWAEAV